LKDLFLERFPHSTTSTWFDREVVGRLGIDPYSGDMSTGTSTIEHGAAGLLIIRSELDDHSKAAALAAFTGANSERMSMPHINSRADSKYARPYRDFLGSVRFERSFVVRMCDNAYMHHFYAGWHDEVIARWAE
jgi:hypothetical protein